MNLAELSDDDLLKLYYQLENEVSFNNNMQMAMKILLNAGYGAVGNASFLYYRVENAEAITMAGQLINKWTCHRLTKLLRHISGNTDRRYVISGDTDSVVGDTIIDVNGVKQTIAEFYDSISEDNLIKNELENQVKIVDNCQSLSVNVKTNEIESKPINYVMKHRVKKRMYAILVDGKKVVVTEDHSIMVKRGDTIISVKPKEILKSDAIITKTV